MNKVAAVLRIGIVMHEAYCHVSTWLSETNFIARACKKHCVPVENGKCITTWCCIL